MQNANKIKLIIGLGNPSEEYQNTYHNVGILAIENKMPLDLKWQTIKGKHFACFKFNEIIWVKPLVFMNESGKAVAEALKFFKLKPEEMLVIHDDSDIALGDYKISFKRGSAGHKGVESIIQTLKTKNFYRLRIGIRPETEKKQIAKNKEQRTKIKAADLVLKKINNQDLQILQEVFEKIYSSLKLR